MLTRKLSFARGAAVAAAGVLVAVGAMGPAVADEDGDAAGSRDDRSSNAEKRAGDGDRAENKHVHDEHEHGKKNKDADRERGAKGQGDARGNGHTPVTVCHLLGNGSYNLLTFDENALDAHVEHGDIYPVPADGCPASESAPGETGSGTTTDGTTAEGTDGATTDDTVDDGTTDEAQIAGVEGFADGAGANATGEVLGAEQFAGANRAATGPLAGILPQTGAGQIGLAAAAGLALLGAGGVLLARRGALGSN